MVLDRGGGLHILLSLLPFLQALKGLLDEIFILHHHFIHLHALCDVLDRVVLRSSELFRLPFGRRVIFLFQIFPYFLAGQRSMILVVPVG